MFKKQRTSTLAFLIITVFIIVGCVASEYVPFEPIVLENDELVPSSIPPSSEFYENLEIVLTHYDVPFEQTDSGIILIPQRIWNDRDTMWNYTTKANDPEWLDARR